ncbi:hypothetical protein N7513_005186 [Penicillium frequentans]|nr:hypothetical protein N7513_005186 [Penicillium glabrum]
MSAPVDTLILLVRLDCLHAGSETVRVGVETEYNPHDACDDSEDCSDGCDDNAGELEVFVMVRRDHGDIVMLLKEMKWSGEYKREEESKGAKERGLSQ